MVRLFLASLCAAVAIWFVVGAVSSGKTSAATPAAASATPDPFIVQVTKSQVNSFADDISANGRFVVIESEGDISTEKTTARNNTDGNREIFLYDYAQRRIFQITNTRPVVNPSATPSPSPSPSPTATPSASPTPTPVDFSNVKVEISNNRPMISLEPALNAQGKRVYRIVFSSNAPTPANFDGTDSAALDADANQEVWVYQLPPVSDVSLTSGADIPFQDLSQGTFTQITNTTASRVPTAGSSTQAPFVADDNREATISDDGQRIAFVSVRDLVPGANGNADGNPEIYLTNFGSGTFTQVTNTITADIHNPIFNSNPCLSSDGSVLAFVSNANLTGDNNDDGNGNGNSEVFIANYNGSTVSGLRQVTKTKANTANNSAEGTTNIFSPGRRLSRDGKLIAFDSLATDPGANGTNAGTYAAFVCSVSAASFAFAQVGPLALSGSDVIHFPTFSDYNAALNPGSVIFASALNFLPDGTFPTQANDSTGLNPQRASQVFLAPIPVQSTGPFTRITNIPSGIAALPALASSSSHGRIAFSSTSSDLGGENGDAFNEVLYHLSPNNTSEPTASISFFTGASLIPVTVPASTSPSPSPSPSPGSPVIAAGLSPGELGIVQATASLAPSAASIGNNSASYASRAPALPIEMNGVSMSINGAACGLYSVSPTQINFVVPAGLTTNTGTASYPVVINNNGTVIRGLLVIVAAQPDVFTTTNGPGGRATVCNVTNPMTAGCAGEPFNVTSDDGTGTQVATLLEVHLTGVRGTVAASINVTVGTTIITSTKAVSTDLPGFDQVTIALPPGVDRGDLPVVVSIGTVTSRPAASAPRIKINP